MPLYDIKFEGFNPKTNETVRKTYRGIEARDTYEATDLLDLRDGLRDRFVFRSYRFELPKKKMPARLRAVVDGAGPDEG